MKTVITTTCLVLVLFMMAGCAGCPDCGSIKKRHEVTQIFLDKQVLPDYSYYYYGERDSPRVILGIDSRYTVQGEYYTPIDLTQEQMDTWIDDSKAINSLAGSEVGYSGFEILDPSDARVGIWYSFYDWGAFKFPGNNVIQIATPSRRPGANR